MKRFASLTALLLTLVLVLSLAACGDKNTADDNQTTDQPSTTQPADTGDAAQTNGATTGSVDLAALRDQLIADCGYTDTLPVETAGLESTIADQAASYDPDSEALAKKCEVVTSGNYVGMFFSSHYDEMVSAFQNAVG